MPAMLDRTAEQFDAAPSRLVADAGYGSAEMRDDWVAGGRTAGRYLVTLPHRVIDWLKAMRRAVRVFLGR
jgi:hypothetical protein